MSRKGQIRTVFPKVEPEIEPDNYYVVDLIENDKVIEVRELPGKSLSYAEDVVENWESGVIQLLTE